MKLPKIGPVTSEELAYAMVVGSAAAANKIPQAGVGGMGVNVDFGDDDARWIGLTDIPENRAMIAIRDQFPREKFMALMMRAWALGEMMRDERAKAYVRDVEGEPEALEVHEAVYDVAAVMPLNAKLRFNTKTFFQRVARRMVERDQEAA